jgi:hypothetical protein
VDWMGAFLVVMAIGFFAVVAVFIWAAAMRMTGRRSRFDQFAQTLVRAQGAAVYPASLRPDPEPAVIEEIEDSRAARADRDTPADEVPQSSTSD